MARYYYSEDGEIDVLFEDEFAFDEVMPPCDADEAYWRYGIE